MFIHYTICKASYPHSWNTAVSKASNVFHHHIQCDYFLFIFQYLLLIKCFYSIECRILFTFLKGTLRGGKAVRKEIHRGSEAESEEKKNRKSGYEKRYWFSGNCRKSDVFFRVLLLFLCLGLSLYWNWKCLKTSLHQDFHSQNEQHKKVSSIQCEWTNMTVTGHEYKRCIRRFTMTFYNAFAV